MQDVSDLVTTTVSNTKISEVKNKIPVVSNLVKKIEFQAKPLEIEGKYLSNSGYNKFASDILVLNIKQKKLIHKSDILNLVKNSDLNTKFLSLAIKAKLKAEQDEIAKLQVFDRSYFHGHIYFMMMVFKNVYLSANNWYVRVKKQGHWLYS